MGREFDPADWISMTSAASLRGVSRAAIADLVQRGRLQSLEIGGRRLVNKSEVLAFQPKPIGRPPKKGEKKELSKSTKPKKK